MLHKSPYRITHLESQVDYWEKCSFPKKPEFVQKAGEACQLVCDVIALRDGKALFQAVVDHEEKLLMLAFKPLRSPIRMLPQNHLGLKY